MSKRKTKSKPKMTLQQAKDYVWSKYVEAETNADWSMEIDDFPKNVKDLAGAEGAQKIEVTLALTVSDLAKIKNEAAESCLTKLAKASIAKAGQ